MVVPLILMGKVKSDYHYSFGTAYSTLDVSRSDVKEMLRYLGIQMDGEYEVNDELVYDNPQIMTIRKDDLLITFFFYWDPAENRCIDCTKAMQERLSADRKAQPVVWRATEPMGKMVQPKLCKAGITNGVLYLAPDQTSDYPGHVEVNLPGVDCGEYDEVVLRASFAGKDAGSGVCSVKVAWQFENEKEDVEILNRCQEVRMRYYRYHVMRTFHFPLAQWLMKEKGRRLKKLYIIIPGNVQETAIESISLTGFKVE
jgi:hypothetical protein